MWIRADLKDRAKAALRAYGYWTAFAVTLLLAVLSGAVGGGSAGRTPKLGYRIDMGRLPDGLSEIGDAMRPLMPLFISLLIVVILASIAYAIFVANPLTVGKNRFFLEHRTRPSGIGTVFYPFRPGYLNVVKAYFFQQIFVFLWSLLLYIPGIVKYYQYFLVPYILAENPHLEWRRALALSRDMTMGSKFDIFVLQLSFVGWFLLGALALGVGILFVFPYYEATAAELYAALRQQAMERGLTTAEELPGVD